LSRSSRTLATGRSEPMEIDDYLVTNYAAIKA
jgi:hypothetical protein